MGKIGEVRRDPFAMLPFCGYNMADYFHHWLNIEKKVAHPPRIFSVNWFRTDEQGKFVWPGFGENMRVLKWIIERCEGRANASESTLGWVPRYEDLEWSGLDFSREQFENVMSLDRESWEREINCHKELFETLKERLPRELIAAS
jgi:phosphoenolpyruvate carboxykinase (GTP)